MANIIYEGSGIDLLKQLDDATVQLLWTDPPFGTDKHQTIVSTGLRYRDGSVNEAVSLMREVGKQARRVLSDDGVLAVCMDYRAIHAAWYELSRYLDPQGEIIWSFGLGRGSTKWWTNKHNTVILFSIRGSKPRFYYERVHTTTRKAPKPGYEGEKRVASVWDYTMSNTDPERVGYPNQKPEAIIEPFVLVHTDERDLVVDPFAGSGTTAAVANRLGRRYAVADISPDAIATIKKRLRDSNG